MAVSKLPIRTASVIEVGGAQREEMEKATGEVAAQRRQRSAAPALDINDWKLPLSVLQLGGFQFGTGSSRAYAVNSNFEIGRDTRCWNPSAPFFSSPSFARIVSLFMVSEESVF